MVWFFFSFERVTTVFGSSNLPVPSSIVFPEPWLCVYVWGVLCYRCSIGEQAPCAHSLYPDQCDSLECPLSSPNGSFYDEV